MTIAIFQLTFVGTQFDRQMGRHYAGGRYHALAYHGTGNGGGNGIGAGLPSSAQKRLVERFTPSVDGASLTYHYELTDSDYLAVPKIGDVKFTYDPQAKFTREEYSLETAHRFLKD